MNMREKLLAERADTLAEARSLTQKEDFDSKDQHRFEVLMARVNGIDHELRRMDVDLRLDENRADQMDAKQIRDLVHGVASTGTAAHGRDFRSLFGEPDTGSEFRSFADFVRAVNTGLADPRLAESRNLAGWLGSAGGFAVPTQFVAGIMDAAIEDALVIPRARIVPMTSDTAKIAAWSDTSHASNVFGGFTGAWLGEAETATRETPTLRQIELNAHKLALFAAASSELVADAPGFEDDLARAMSKTIGFYSDAAFISGTGAGQPLGVLNDPALISISSSAGAGSIVGDDLPKMLARLHPACYKRAVWVVSSEALGVLWILKNDEGDYLFRPSETGAGGVLLGLPVVVSEHCARVGTVGDVILADFSQYVVGLRREIVLERTNAASWTTDEIDYRVILRVDGMGSWQSALTPKNSGDTLSWAVAIATRS